MTHDGPHTGRRILITGGTSGIGRACAERLCHEGARVWALGSHKGGAAALARDVPVAGTGVCDVGDPGQVERAVAEAAEAMGGLDGVFVNAGVDGQALPAARLDPGAFRRLLDVNVVGALITARAAARAMPPGSAIVFNASVNALRPERHFADYNASKAAVVAIAKTMALELAPEITVSAVCAGYFPTRMTRPYLDDPMVSAEILAQIPAERVGELPEMAALIAFLLGPEARYMTGAVVTIDGGRSV